MNEQAKSDFESCNERIHEFNQLRQLSFGRYLPDTRFVLTEDEFKCMQRIKELKVGVNLNSYTSIFKQTLFQKALQLIEPFMKDSIEKLKQEYRIHCEQAAYCKLQSIAAAERLLEEFNKLDGSVLL